MRMRTYVGRSCLMAAIALVLNGGVASEADACSCLQPTVESSYNNSTDVVVAEVRWEFVLGSTRYYLVRVERTYKGCLESSDRVLLKTPVDEAGCGLDLSDRTHLIHGTAEGRAFGVPVLSIGLCSYNVPAAALTEHDLAFLNGRTVCCGEDCSCADGSQPVQCFADPCSVAPACEAGQCRANYCGGCNAEFYDDSGYAVCQAEGECRADADCPEDEWCRQTAASESAVTPSFECVPFVGEGQSCNGFTRPSMLERCEPGLTCDTPDLIADASGVCRRSCESDADCPSDGYCATDGLCDRDGACERAADCGARGNVYPQPACVGYASCDDSNQCGWQCGDPRCVDRVGADFGPCDAVLGWAVLNGTCSEVSGCTADTELFASQAECQTACQPGTCEDLSSVDFGPCRRLLGAGVVNGECVTVGGCDPRGYALFPDVPSCERACTFECASDADCMATGCSGQVCAAENVTTTCEFRPEYACYQDPAVGRCGCHDGRCAWAQTDALRECLADAGDTSE